MYSVSNQMPLQNYQIVSPSENQTNFLAGQVIRFTIPRNIGFWDPHTSYLRLQVAAENMNYKVCFLDSINSIIEMVRVSQNGTTILETTNYNTLTKFLKDYSESLSLKQKNAVADGSCDYIVQATGAGGTGWNPSEAINGPRTVTSGCLYGQGLNADASVSIDDSAKDCKFNLPLDGVGLFDMPQLCPSIILGDLLVEIRLVQQNADGLKVLPATSVYNKIKAASIGTGTTNLVIEPHEFNGFTNLADSPYAINQTIRFLDANKDVLTGADHLITALSQDNDTGEITITFGTPTDATEDPSNLVVITKGTDGNEAVKVDTRFVVKRSDLMLNVVRPPAQYIESMTRKVLSEGLEIDLNVFTAYQATLQSAIKAQTVEIPSFVSRAKSVFTIPRIQNSPTLTINGATNADVQGQYKSLKNYRWQVGTTYYPNQPIELDQLLGGLHFSQQHIVELEKALIQGDIPVRSLLKTKQNFVVARALAKHGSTVNLDAGLRVYLEYNATTDPDAPLDVVSFVKHINRIVVGEQGVAVLA
jgi:hypothetical protein